MSGIQSPSSSDFSIVKSYEDDDEEKNSLSKGKTFLPQTYLLPLSQLRWDILKPLATGKIVKRYRSKSEEEKEILSSEKVQQAIQQACSPFPK